MTAIKPSMPLSVLDAVVIDTETTGLDARSARLLQIALVPLAGGALDAEGGLDEIVDPGVPIPPASTAVHGLSDRDVANKPPFKELAPRLERLAAGRLWIGHTLAYDLSILKREYESAGLAWQAPRALDVRLLARVAAPGLADHGLDRLCEWLGVVNAGRHTAKGDAVATAEVFLKLVPLLRKAGVRTLAEAEAACRQLAEQEARTTGGLVVIDAARSAPTAVFGLDAFAYRHRVSDVMSAPPTVLPGSASLSQAIDALISNGISSVLVELQGGVTGIVTERDALRAVASLGAQGLDAPLSTIAKAPLLSVRDADHVYRAIGRMDRLGIRHLGVVGGDGRVRGVLTPRNLLRNRASAAILIGDAIAAARSASDLAAAWADVPRMAAGLMREDVDARAIAGVVSSEICAITGRAAELAETQMEREGRGRAPVPYCVLVLGSAGRGESLLAADQDNAIVFEAGDPGGPADQWFERLGSLMADTLDETGIAYCKGGVMARNALWRHSAAGWRDLVETWIRRQRPEDLLNVDIFFDAVPVHGAVDLGTGLWQHAYERARTAKDFLVALSEVARRWRSPVSFLGGFTKSNGRVDLKLGGLLPIFTAARVLSLRHGVLERSTKGRLEGVRDLGIGAPSDIAAAVAAHEHILRLVLEQQIEDGARGVALSPRVEVDRLGKDGRRALKEALDAVPSVIDIMSEGRV